MKKWMLTAALAVACVGLLAGCQEEPAAESVQEQTEQAQVTQAEVETEAKTEAEAETEEAESEAEIQTEETEVEEETEAEVSEAEQAAQKAQELARQLEELTAEEYAQAEEQLAGTWIGSDGTTMWISFRKGVCSVDIERVDGENSEYWHFSEYPGKKDDFMLVAVDCSKYEVTKDNGFAQELVYEDGIAVISVADGKITWQDGAEDAGAGVVFEKKAAQ